MGAQLASLTKGMQIQASTSTRLWQSNTTGLAVPAEGLLAI